MLRDRDLVPNRKKGISRQTILLAAGIGLAAAFGMRFVLHAFWKYPASVAGDEMKPGIHPGAVVYIRPRIDPSKLKRGDIVLLRHPLNGETKLVRRVAGIGGDVVQIVNRRLYVNQAPFKDSWEELAEMESADDTSPLSAEITRRDNTEPVYVKVGEVFLLADNRKTTLDSRHWGAVKLEFLEGLVEP